LLFAGTIAELRDHRQLYSGGGGRPAAICRQLLDCTIRLDRGGRRPRPLRFGRPGRLAEKKISDRGSFSSAVSLAWAKSIARKRRRTAGENGEEAMTRPTAYLASGYFIQFLAALAVGLVLGGIFAGVTFRDDAAANVVAESAAP
jgi:hypothetical protein